MGTAHNSSYVLLDLLDFVYQRVADGVRILHCGFYLSALSTPLSAFLQLHAEYFDTLYLCVLGSMLKSPTAAHGIKSLNPAVTASVTYFDVYL